MKVSKLFMKKKAKNSLSNLNPFSDKKDKKKKEKKKKEKEKKEKEKKKAKNSKK